MKCREQIVLLGMSGNTHEIFEHVESCFSIEAILDDNPALTGTYFDGVPILPMRQLADFPEARVVMMIGSQKSVSRREAIIGSLNIDAERFPTVIHSRAHVSRFARIGRGTVIFPGAVVTSNAVIGDHVMVLPNSVIHHDVVIDDFTLIGSNVTVAGNVRIGRACYVGSASSFRNGVEVGDGSVIGMAANVLTTVAAGTTVIGNPARVLQPKGGQT